VASLPLSLTVYIPIFSRIALHPLRRGTEPVEFVAVPYDHDASLSLV
jgi:hypothetical protein